MRQPYYFACNFQLVPVAIVALFMDNKIAIPSVDIVKDSLIKSITYTYKNLFCILTEHSFEKNQKS